MEYQSVASSISLLSDPSLPAAKKARTTKGKYTVYTPEKRAMIGKYALEDGDEKARLRFLAEFPNLSESTIRNFKSAYKEYLKTWDQITALPSKPRGRPPIRDHGSDIYVGETPVVDSSLFYPHKLFVLVRITS